MVGTSSLRRQVLLQAAAARPEDRAPARQPRHPSAQAGRRPVRRHRAGRRGPQAPGDWASASAPRSTPPPMLPAAGQGALGIEMRSDRQDLIDALAPLAHMPTWLTVTAERAVSRAMGGSCSMPLAAHGTLTGDHPAAAMPPGATRRANSPWCAPRASATVTTLAQADALGLAIAQRTALAGPSARRATRAESRWCALQPPQPSSPAQRAKPRTGWAQLSAARHCGRGVAPDRAWAPSLTPRCNRPCSGARADAWTATAR